MFFSLRWNFVKPWRRCAPWDRVSRSHERTLASVRAVGGASSVRLCQSSLIFWRRCVPQDQVRQSHDRTQASVLVVDRES